ncbi:hypothetical protein NA78x_002891 [Anatilimnocola sp. NA78]|uniref:hypothetical protein n=1 Tax=Anatilimnocola sp. NA78 TaxID=3415683 RepID=UPI003CE51EEE
MFRCHRSTIKTIRPLLRAALELTPKQYQTAVTFAATASGLLVRARSAKVAIELSIEGEGSGDPISVPYQALTKVESHIHDWFGLTATADECEFCWVEAGIPQTLSAPALESGEWPELPVEQSANSPELLAALVEATATTAPESRRFALGCVQFRGTGGQLTATDGRQALVQEGFTFPWPDDVLAARCLAFRKLRVGTNEKLLVGRTADWLVIRAPRWTVWLKIETEARFPDVEGQIPSREFAETTLAIAEQDAKFLLGTVNHMPGGADQNGPLTIDLNGAVALRAQCAASPAMELVLTRSQRTGAEVRCCTDRRFLQRAVQLGFREIMLRGSVAPLYCRDARRAYVWAILSPDGCVGHNQRATQIVSQGWQPSRADRSTRH